MPGRVVAYPQRTPQNQRKLDEMLVTSEEYKSTFNNYYIVDCAARDRNVFAFALDRILTDAEVEEEEEKKFDRSMRPKRLITFFRQEAEGDRCGGTDFDQWGHLTLGAMTVPKSQFLLYELHKKRVYVIGSGEETFETPLDGITNVDSPMHSIVEKIKTFNGKAFMSGGNRGFAERLGPNKYRSHKNLVRGIPYETGHGGQDGFYDFDLFAEDDIYAAGGKGDVWHFNGTAWRQIPLPTNAWLQTVCCGGDGMVYISGYEGLCFMGRGDSWKQISSGGVYLGWRDMVWFEGKAWATSENGLWTIENGQVAYLSGLPSEVRVCAGNLYVADGVMLLAGLGGACFRENGQWHNIFTKRQMDRILASGHS
jgi:hypothetical protein